MSKIEINENTMVVQVGDLMAADMDGEKVMMCIGSGKYYGLDAIGSRIWELICVPTSVAQLVTTLAEEYDVAKSVCCSDTKEFIEYLHKEGLVRVV